MSAKDHLEEGDVVLIIGDDIRQYRKFQGRGLVIECWSPDKAESATDLPEKTRIIIEVKWRKRYSRNIYNLRQGRPIRLKECNSTNDVLRALPAMFDSMLQPDPPLNTAPASDPAQGQVPVHTHIPPPNSGLSESKLRIFIRQLLPLLPEGFTPREAGEWLSEKAVDEGIRPANWQMCMSIYNILTAPQSESAPEPDPKPAAEPEIDPRPPLQSETEPEPEVSSPEPDPEPEPEPLALPAPGPALEPESVSAEAMADLQTHTAAAEIATPVAETDAQENPGATTNRPEPPAENPLQSAESPVMATKEDITQANSNGHHRAAYGAVKTFVEANQASVSHLPYTQAAQTLLATAKAQGLDTSLTSIKSHLRPKVQPKSRDYISDAFVVETTQRAESFDQDVVAMAGILRRLEEENKRLPVLESENERLRQEVKNLTGKLEELRNQGVIALRKLQQMIGVPS